MQYQSQLTSFPDHNYFSSLKVLQHSLNTPITNLLINLELLTRCAQTQPKQLNDHLYLKRCLLSAQYLKTLVKQCDDLKNYQCHQFNVLEAIHEVIEICKNPKQQGLLLPFLQLTGDEYLRGNKLYFQEVIVCLLNNAFQSYENYAPNKLVLLFMQTVKQTLNLKITDAGKGFLCLRDSGGKAVTSDKLNNKGTGLTFIEQVVLKHFSGQIKIESQPHKNTTIHCSFPLAKK
jgi:K+-sensing histidine kinase KdpD